MKMRVIISVTFMLALTSKVLATTNECYRLEVYDADFVATKSLIIARQDANLTFYVGLRSMDTNDTSSATEHYSVQLSSFGVQPVVSLSNTSNGRVGESVIDVVWKQEHMAWSVSNTTDSPSISCRPGCLVVVRLSSRVDDCLVKEWKGAILAASEVPVLDWMLRLDAQFESDAESAAFDGSGTLSHLQCHPDASVTIRGHHGQMTFTTNLYLDSSNSTYNLCDVAGLSGPQCAGMVVQDIALTYSRLLILTSSGLLVSTDVAGSSPALVFVGNLPFATQGARFIKVDALICQHPVLSKEMVMVAPSGQPGDVFSVYVAYPPYQTWSSVVLCSSGCGGSSDPVSRLVAYDSQRQTYIVATTSENVRTTIHLVQENGVQLTSTFQLPFNDTLNSIHFHSTTASVYLVGSKVLMSVDGGFNFDQLLALSNNESVTDFNLSEQALAFATSSGRLFYGRPGIRRVMELQSLSLSSDTSKLLFDSSGQLHEVQFGNQSIESISVPLFKTIKEAVLYCNLTTEPVHSHMVYLLNNDSTSLCLTGETNIGMVASGPTSIGKGMVVYAGASSLGNAGFVMVFHPLQPDVATDEDSQWSFHEEECWIQLCYKNQFESQVYYEVDIGDHVQIQVESFLANVDVELIESSYLIPRHLWDISVTFGNPELFDFSSTIDHHYPRQRVTVDIWQRDHSQPIPFYSTVTFQLIHCPLVCETCSLTTVLSSSCPSNKLLRFIYPTTQEGTYKLPTNYRPPSHLGVSISTSPHVYNADPSLPLMNSQISHSSSSAQYKQCDGADTRSNCDCSMELETSTDIAFSDCIRKVYRQLYEVEFLMNFTLYLGVGREVTVQHSISIEELNNRTDFNIKDQANITEITPGGSYTIIFAVSPHDQIKGPGLYHFRATLLDVLSFCPLATQFTVYVDRTPLTKAGEYTVTILTTVLFGVGALAIYLVYNAYHLGQSHHK